VRTPERLFHTKRMMKIQRIVIIGLLACWGATVYAQATGRVTLLAQRLFDHGSTGGNYYSSCWGYTDSTGQEYALMGSVNGLSVVDITDTDSLREVAFIPGPTSAWREIKTHSHYAYVVSEASSGVQIVDLSQLPDTAWLVQAFNYTSGTNNILRNHTISIHDGYMYLNGSGNWSPASVLIFSLANPVNPTFISQWGSEYIHDSMVRNDTLFASAIFSPGGLNIVNVTNKSNPQFITKITYSGAGTHNAWTTEDGNYVVTTDEIGTTTKTLKVWDISNLPGWSYVTEFTVDPTAVVHNVHIKGRYAYVAWYTAGAHVVDLSDPTVPTHAGGYDTFPRTPTGPYQGCWGVFPYYNSNKFIASDRQTGLYVFSFDTSAAGVRQTGKEIPSTFSLSQNYPNPFNPDTKFEMRIAEFGPVTLKVYNVLGQEVATLVNEELRPGTYTVSFDASHLCSNVYLYRISAGGFSQTRSMVLLR
jgi:choice-of-anchor B domain-containing protein